MRLSDVIEILARRLRMKRGRVAAIANRLQHAGAVPLADAKKTPPELSAGEIASLLIAVLAERGVEGIAERYSQYSAMTADGGYRLAETVTAILRGHAQPGDLIVKDGGVTATVNGVHVVFGNPAEDGNARFVTSATLAAIVAELSGASPAHADAVAAITRIRNH